jgi:uncharacterized damage-inducible protein DinB
LTELEKQVIDAWKAHNRIMLFAIENTPDQAFGATLSTRGGRDIARQFAHLHMVRIWRLEATSRKLANGLEKFEKGTSPDKPKLLSAFTQSGAAVEIFLQHSIEKAGAISNFKRQAVPTLCYFIAHEAHHRGNILLTMKQSGFKLPEKLKWGIWDWNKFNEAN